MWGSVGIFRYERSNYADSLTAAFSTTFPVGRSVCARFLAAVPRWENRYVNVCALKCCSCVACIFLIRVTFVRWRKNISPFGTHFVASSQAHSADHKSYVNINVTVNVRNSSFSILFSVAPHLVADVLAASPCVNFLRMNAATTLWRMSCVRLQIILQHVTSKQQQTDDNLLAATPTTFTASNVYVVTLSVFTPANCHLT